MNTVRCIYILEREHLLILVNIWLLFIWYICTYAAVMQLCSEPRWHCFWSHVFALIKQLFISFFPLSSTDDHKHFMSFYDALSSFFIFWCFTDSVRGKNSGGGGVKNVLCSLVVFETFQSFFFLDFFHVFSFFRETCCTQIQGATMISRWCVFLHLNWINQYHLL